LLQHGVNLEAYQLVESLGCRGKVSQIIVIERAGLSLVQYPHVNIIQNQINRVRLSAAWKLLAGENDTVSREIRLDASLRSVGRPESYFCGDTCEGILSKGFFDVVRVLATRWHPKFSANLAETSQLDDLRD